MKLTKSKLKQLIKEEIEAVREEFFGDDNENIFDPSTYEGMFVSRFIDTFEDSLREFISAYLDEEDLNVLEDDQMEDLKTAVMTALENAKKADPDARVMVKTALEDVEAANSTGGLRYN